MALIGAITEFCLAEFASISVWTAVVVNIDEVEADDPLPRAEDYRRLLSGDVVDGGFVVTLGTVYRCWGCNRRSSSYGGVCDSFDELLIDSSLQPRLTDDP